MERHFLQFIAALRHHGLPVSTSETLDGFRVLALLGYQNKEPLKNALAISLAKTAHDKDIFFRCFDIFYNTSSNTDPESNPKHTITLDKNTEESTLERQQALSLIQDTPPTLSFQSPLSELLLSGDSEQLSVRLHQALAEGQVGDIRHYTQLGQKTRQLLTQAGIDTLTRDIQTLKALDTHHAEQTAIRLQEGQAYLRQEAKQLIEKQWLLNADHEGQKLQAAVLQKSSLSALEERHFHDMKHLVRKLAKRLALRHQRKYRVSRRGQLHVPQTLRQSIRFDGIPFTPYWKKKKKDQAKLIVLCDVSHSVAAFAKFLLLFVYSLNDVLPKVRSFAFSNRLGEISQLFNELDAASATEQAFKRWGQGGSDYGRSLQDFANEHLAAINHNTVIIILGDSRNNGAEPRLDILQSMYKRARMVFWLNPEPITHWNTGDSEIERYRSACHLVAPCQSLQQLERAIDRVLQKML